MQMRWLVDHLEDDWKRKAEERIFAPQCPNCRTDALRLKNVSGRTTWACPNENCPRSWVSSSLEEE